MWWCSAFALAATGCQGDERDGIADQRRQRSSRACVDVLRILERGDDRRRRDAAFVAAFHPDAPAELSGAAAVVTAADPAVPSPEAEAAVAQIQDWVQLNCQSVWPGDSRRHIAPTLDADFQGATFCGTTSFPAMVDGESGMVLYGVADAKDPYDGPMLGLLWNPTTSGLTVEMAIRCR